MAATAAVCVASLAGWRPTSTATLVICIAAVAIGMPHGALDVVVGPRLWGSARFMAVYGALVPAVVAIWLIAPVVSLAAFLTISWWHFGIGDATEWDASDRWRVVRAAATGGLVLGGPMAAHPDVVRPVFVALVGEGAAMSESVVLAWGLAMLAVAVPCAIAVVLAHLARREHLLAGELPLLALLVMTASPLVAFSCYFALTHSLRHVVATGADRRDLTPVLAATALTLVAGAGAWWLLEPSIDTALKVVFVGLSALTVPHLVVTSALHRRLATDVR
jgi:beta-carotene 15,15'-dioxygenase